MDASRSIASSAEVVASITGWTRLEPDPHDPAMTRALQAQVRDPLWMLARQWQVGEFEGDDAGSPVQASLGTHTRSLTTYRPGTADSATVALDPGVPLEAHVEREPVALQLMGSVQLGFRFESMIRERIAPPATASAAIAAFRSTYPIAATDADPMNASGAQVRAFAAGRVTDGVQVRQTALDIQAGRVPATPFPPSAMAIAGMQQIIDDFLAYYSSAYSEPAGDNAWQAGIQRYAFGDASPAPSDVVAFAANAFGGGHVDWYTYSIEDNPSLPAGLPQTTITDDEITLLPNHVVFRGMPDSRWWNFEDAAVDFGQLDTQHVDLAKMLVMEFALVYGNDWFIVPFKRDMGSLTRLNGLVVTDTFGQRTIIRPAEQTTVNEDERPWSMFKIGGLQERTDYLLLTPTIDVVVDADPLEDVFFLRDDMAAMAWAVEDRLAGPLDTGVDAYEAYLTRIRLNPPPAPPPVTAESPPIRYELETTVPDNWIPLVPVRTPTQAPYLRRGLLVRATSSGFENNYARAEILEPDHPLFIADRVVPREGREIRRYFRRARWTDGSTHLWLARRSSVGRGPGFAGLAFDLVLLNTPAS